MAGMAVSWVSVVAHLPLGSAARRQCATTNLAHAPQAKVAGKDRLPLSMFLNVMVSCWVARGGRCKLEGEGVLLG